MMFGKQKDNDDPKSLPFDQLLDMKRKLDLEIAGRQGTELETLRAKVTAFADALGISVAEMFGIRTEQPERRGKKRRDTVKFRDPDNPENTWSGRGRLPKWLQEKIDQGASRELFQAQ